MKLWEKKIYIMSIQSTVAPKVLGFWNMQLEKYYYSVLKIFYLR